MIQNVTNNAFMLNVVVLNVVMLSVFILSARDFIATVLNIFLKHF